ncbi:MAG: tetratricopeptide repeat protein [Woeseiaceae bacterium]|nr:tetratricopeptide repeat protein [Woeseiaceae bacterium]
MDRATCREFQTRRLCRSAVAVLAASTLAACATSSTSDKPPPVRIEIQEAVGFTITEASHISSDNRAEYDEAQRHLVRGDLERGIELLEIIVERAPNLSAPRIDLGIAEHRAGNLEAAERHLQAVLEVNPDHPIALNELGIVYRKTGRFTLARQSYEGALAIYPGYHFARRNLAVLCDLYLADLECALRNYEAYLATVPGDEEAAIWIADIRYRLGRPEGS